MAIRGKRNPFPKVKKTQSNVFTTPQKMDPAPAGLSAERSVMERALGGTRKGYGGGTSASAVKAHACRGPKSR